MLVVVAAVFPLGGVSVEWVALPAAVLAFLTFTPTGAIVEPPRCDVSEPALACLLDPRGPPSVSFA